MASVLRSTAALVTVAFLILSFQNCGDAGFKAIDASNVGFGSSGGIAVPNPTPAATPPPNTLLQVPAGKVAVFVAQGHVGRTLMSCDDGQTWIHDRSENDSAVCYDTNNPNFVECDHSSLSANGMDFGDGHFFISLGHGEPGTARVSEDGYNWRVIRNGNTDAGIAYYKGVLNWFASGYQRSTDLGLTWYDNSAALPPIYMISRTSSRFENYIAVTGDDADRIISNDSGKTWSKVNLNGMQWSRNLVIAKGLGLLVAVSALQNPGGSYAWAMYSKDDGITWTGKALLTSTGYGPGWSNMIFDGTKFMAWINQQMWSSTDGINWTATDLSPKENITEGPIARGASGTFIAIPGAFGSSYSNQKMYRSKDGINWTAVDATKYKGGHPISRVTAGYVDPAACQ